MTTKKSIGGSRAMSRRTTPRIGDSVQMMFANVARKGRIVEDQGRIGSGGRNLYDIEMPMSYSEPMHIVFAAEDFRITRRAPIAKKPPRKTPARSRKKPEPSVD